MRTRDDLLGARVVATNERGGRWHGRCVTFTLGGMAVVDCDGQNVGYGWQRISELRQFPIEWLELEDD